MTAPIIPQLGDTDVRADRCEGCPGRRNRRWKQHPLNVRAHATTVGRLYQGFWTVRNFGAGARRAHALRGEIYDGDGAGNRYERTAHRGDHSVERYTVRNGVCVAQREGVGANRMSRSRHLVGLVGDDSQRDAGAVRPEPAPVSMRSRRGR